MPKSTRNRSAGRVRRGRGTTSTVETIIRPSQSLPVIIALSIWRWRWEIACLTALAVVYYHLTTPDGWEFEPVPALLLMAAPVPVVLAIRPVRRFLRNRVWCVITRHRIRACLTEMRTLNYSGNLPFIIGCFSTKTGEAVWLWMRPGLSAEDLENKAETIASACWARKALIGRTDRNAALIRVDIDRRDPLAKTHITSPLLDDTSGMPEAAVADDALLAFITPESASSEPIAEAPARADTNAGRTKTSKTKTTAAVNDSQTVILGTNGEDVSDYV
ncbi:hypothetical protein EV643_1616 [Kribbella sp. VKM Ac-2527]|uniref:Uncharacterized protein n=1 Tax=Kribbella caucasensis TaxID=2512215 RepID=A0A4R6IXA3_9ACTN|nr:hypothetical protein [Kribbella sp. VKM Ac-2527]TDO27363.1 hypothetical protein EV643_1616 [Kribbella sp. VKM Ac-2527]